MTVEPAASPVPLVKGWAAPVVAAGVALPVALVVEDWAVLAAAPLIAGWPVFPAEPVAVACVGTGDAAAVPTEPVEGWRQATKPASAVVAAKVKNSFLEGLVFMPLYQRKLMIKRAF
jgi:hypothetical protein